MREIKFRAWVKFDSGNYGMLDHENLIDWSLREVLDDEGTDALMQFTGRHDRDGKEVYEGDLLRHDWTLDGEERHALSEVFWDAGMLAFRLITRSAYGSKKELRVHFTPPELSPIDHYVVGNIYENPELLTKN